MGVPAPARGVARPRRQGGRLHGPGNPQGRRHPPSPERTSTTRANFLRSQADALLACDFFEAITLSGARLYVLAVIEHTNRRIRILGATEHPTASWVTQAAKNLVMEWVQTCRRELPDRTLIWNQRHLHHTLREFEHFYNEHRPHQALTNARPLHPLPQPITHPEDIAHLDIRKRERLGGILHEYRHAA